MISNMFTPLQISISGKGILIFENSHDFNQMIWDDQPTIRIFRHGMLQAD